MPIKPVHEFIPRDIPAPIKTQLDQYSNTIDELVNLGSNIIAWDEGSHWVDSAIIMQLRNYLELVDAISILIRASSISPAKLPLRGALESLLQLLFILKEEPKKKSIAFIIHDNLDQLSVLQRLKQTHAGSGSFRGKTYNLQEEIDARERILSWPDINEVYKLFEAFKEKSKNKKFPKHWYQIFGTNSLKDMAHHLEKSELYEKVYSWLSASAHGVDVISGRMSRDEDGFAEITQIRLWDNATVVARFTINLSIELFEKYIDHRTPEHKQEYQMWFDSINDDIFAILKPHNIL